MNAVAVVAQPAVVDQSTGPAPSTDLLKAAQMDLERVQILVNGVTMLSPSGSCGRLLTAASQMLGVSLYTQIAQLAFSGEDASSLFLDEMYNALAMVEGAAALANGQEGPEFRAFCDHACEQLDALSGKFDVRGDYWAIFQPPAGKSA